MMNTVTSLTAIVSLLLALAAAGGAAKEQAGADSQAARPITTSKLGVNHNETLVNDATPVRQVNGSFHATKMAGCPIWYCGTNHNETLMSDATSAQQTSTLSRWLTSIQAVFFTSFSTNARGGAPCEDWGCGMNHNETLVSDAAR